MKNTIIITLLTLATLFCVVSTSATTIGELEAGRIYSLLQKVDIPDDLRKDITQRLASEPDLAVSDGDFTTLWYVTRDTVRFGIITLPAGHGMKQWTFGEKIDGNLWYNTYQIASIDEGRVISLQVIRDFDGLEIIFVAVLLFLAILLVLVLWRRIV